MVCGSGLVPWDGLRHVNAEFSLLALKLWQNFRCCTNISQGVWQAQGDSSSPQDLCERHEKGVLHEHQRALHKYSMMKRQMMSATVQPKEQASVEQLESRIVQVDSQFLSPIFCFPGLSLSVSILFLEK